LRPGPILCPVHGSRRGPDNRAHPRRRGPPQRARRARVRALLGGWKVDLAENAQHGLTRLAASPPDAVVLDVGLPDMDGLVLCRRLRRAGNDTRGR
jgi:two-component system, OmpR family, KDP operon response regulator KdpE